MRKRSFAKGVPVALILTVLVLFSVFEVFSAQTAKFTLSDAQAEVNRIFEITLSAKGEYSLSAFVAELLYDPEVIRFDSASVSGDASQYSVNSLEKGKLTAVYLNEDGVSCTEGTSVMSFKFKALSAGNTQIKLSVRDAITPLSEDMNALECVDSNVAVLSKAKADKIGNNTSVAEESAYAVLTSNEESGSFIKGTTHIGGVPVSNQTIVSVVLSFLCTLCIAVYMAYKIGAHRQKEKQKPAPLVYKDKAGKDKFSD